MDEPRIANITVLLGAHDRTISEPSQVIVNVPRLNIIRHPDYDRNTLTNDLCVLRFPRPVEFTNYVYPIELAMNNELEHNLFRNYAASVSGWGLTENWVSSPVLRFIRHSIMPNEYCKETWHHLVTDYHICSNTIAGRSGCNGDSGGPLTVEQYGRSLQAGIVSFGSMDCTVKIL